MSFIRRLAIPAAAAIALLSTTPTAARAGQPSEPRFAAVRVSEGYYPVTAEAHPYLATTDPCAVRLARRTVTTALDALQAAKQQGCIASYFVEQTASGPYLSCINARCEALGFYWAVYLNGALTCSGVADVVLAPGDELTFSFEPYPTALALVACELPPTTSRS